MPDGSRVLAEDAIVGPNAILQLKAPMDRLLGPGVLAQVLDLCRVPMPSGECMIPERQAAQVHHMLWQLFPDRARAVSEEAGGGTACYIRRNRIPQMARVALRLLPAPLAERMLTQAIEKHAWTFCGSGTFGSMREGKALHFLIRDNPLADRQSHPPHACYWHSAVFAQLYSSLLGRRYSCSELSCCAMGAEVCHFTVSRQLVPASMKGA